MLIHRIDNIRSLDLASALDHGLHENTDVTQAEIEFDSPALIHDITLEAPGTQACCLKLDWAIYSIDSHDIVIGFPDNC